ncbi:DMT family transporter [Prosthecomicrobium sp. N25]|uniref:DMT family transporter n=1 Tax=Prosthecomicrobium sp. N25 TaxID=3129254 RepID=UPI0030784D42
MSILDHDRLSGLRVGWRALPPNLAASILIMGSFGTFTVMSILVRVAAERLPVIEIIFLRQIIAMLLLSPVFFRTRYAITHARNAKLHIARGVTGIGAMSCGLTAVVHIPFADATAIQLAEVIFITIFAALILKEKVGRKRWSATGVGFAGVMVMLGPFSAGLDPYALIALAGAFFGAATVTTLRMGAGSDGTGTVIFYQGLIVLVIVGPLAGLSWVTPTWREGLVLLGMGLVFVTGQWLFTMALRLGEASALAPLNYVRLVMMSVVGYLYYAEVPSVQTALGAVLIVGSATYTIRENARRKPDPGPPPLPSPPRPQAGAAPQDRRSDDGPSLP